MMSAKTTNARRRAVELSIRQHNAREASIARSIQARIEAKRDAGRPA